jgi:hypothetical protein
VDELDHREPVGPVGRLEVLRRQVDVYDPGDAAAVAGHRGPDQVALPLGQLEMGPAPIERAGSRPGGELDVGHLGCRGGTLLGEVRQHGAPGLVVAVVLVDAQDAEHHGRNERDARREDAEGCAAGRRVRHISTPKIAISKTKSTVLWGSSIQASGSGTRKEPHAAVRAPARGTPRTSPRMDRSCLYGARAVPSDTPGSAV